MEKKEKAKIHVHGEFSIFDAMSTKKIVNRAKEMGVTCMSLTDHGTMMGVPDFMKLTKEAGIKAIPGVEAYVEEENSLTGRIHLLLLAKDYEGYRKISKAVSRSNGNIHRGFPCMNKALIKEFLSGGNNVIASSACMQGVLSVPLLINQKIEKKIEKEKRAMDRLSKKPDDESYLGNKALYQEALEKLNSLRAKKKELQKLAGKSFEGKLKKANTDEKLAAVKAEMEQSEAAAKELALITAKIAEETARQSAINKEIKADEKSHERYFARQKNIRDLESQRVPEEQLYNNALEEAKWYDEMFGHGNFFAELQYHGIKEEALVMPIIARIAKELDLPMIATNDVHIATNSDADRYTRQLLRSQRNGEWCEEGIGDSELYLKSDEELKESLLKILDEETVDKAFEGLDIIENACNVEIPKEEHYPKFKPETFGETADGALQRKAVEGIYRRYGVDGKLVGWTKEKKERLIYELSVISKMGYSDYHLIVADFLEYGRLLGVIPEEFLDEAPIDKAELKIFVDERGYDAGLGIGPGRGSAVGSIVCYLVGITDLDPMEYDLLFERFLNVERISMPDIDSDFSPAIREKVIEYVKYKYGEKAVCCITTKGTRAAKSAVKSYARVSANREAVKIIQKKYSDFDFNSEFSEIDDKFVKKSLKDKGEELARIWADYADTICKLIPNTPGITLAECEENIMNTLKDKSNFGIYKEIYENAKLLEGSFASYGMHAAGVIISDNEDVSDYIPLMWNGAKEQWSCQCNMVQAEDAGLLKMDFLGLKNLKIISDTIRMIKEHTGVTIFTEKIPYEKEVFKEIYAKGNTNFIFQFESNGMKEMLTQFQPDGIEDIILLNAAYRPGPMQYLEKIINIKHKREPLTYLIPELEPILGKTYGSIIYQEQVMSIVQELAGYSLGQADLVRRAMSKKKEKVLEKERASFINGDPERNIEGTKARGIDSEKANQLFDEMMDFAKYAFNKSHAAAYSRVSYITAWLKYHYPKEYLCGVMNTVDLDKAPAMAGDCVMYGIKLCVPDINTSKLDFDSSAEKPEIYFGLKKVKNVGQAAAYIVEKRKETPFRSFKDFVMRGHIKKDSTESLIKAGAFDQFCSSRAALLDALPELVRLKGIIDDKTQVVKECTMLLENYSEEMYNNNTFTTFKNFPKKRDTVESKLQAAKKDLREANASFDNVIIYSSMVEDNKQKLLDEQEMLGVYVSAHPMDEYNSPESYGCTSINKVKNGEAKIIGAIKEFEVKNRKADGAKMAFFTLEDKTGFIPVCCFTKAFAEYGEILEKEGEGGVVCLKGKCVVERTTTYEQDEATGEDVEVYHEAIKFFANEVISVSPEKKPLIMELENAEAWDEIRPALAQYEDSTGHPLKVFLKNTKKIRTTTLFVKEDILNNIFKISFIS